MLHKNQMSYPDETLESRTVVSVKYERPCSLAYKVILDVNRVL